MADLAGRVAVVAGGSRGAGKGIALALGDAGATVYVAGRTSKRGPAPSDGAPGTIEDTADEVTRRGGVGMPVPVDCTVDEQVAHLFARVEEEQGRVDVVANAVWGAADGFASVEESLASWGKPFWEQSTLSWHHMMNAGPYAYYLTSTHALRLMTRTGGGLIVGITDGYVEAPAGTIDDGMGTGPFVWSLSHQCINLLMKGMAAEAKKHKVAVVTLMPGFMRTERVARAMTTEKIKKQFGYDQSESTEFVGRAVAALAADKRVHAKSGKIHFVADLAAEYGFTDVDGRQVPRFNPFAATS
jgi:NAD(P)-dependent dehydrogenase (short-subunit alcohol dehydrogenase family)